MVVVVDVTVDRLNHFTRRLKSVEIAQLVFEAPVERLDKAILPGRRHVADGDLDIPLVKIIGTALRHELSALVGMKDQRRHTGCESLVQGRQNQMTIVALANTFCQDLACGKVFDCRQIPDRASMRLRPVNHKRVERIWRREGLKVPPKQPKRGRLWLNDGSCIRLWPVYTNHVWSYDFMQDHTHNGLPFRILNIIDEFTRECLVARVERRLSHCEVLEELTWLFCTRGLPAYIRSDNGPEFTVERVRDWLSRLNVGPLFIEKGSPWENGYIESFNGKMRDELLNGEIFYSLKEAQVLIEDWRCHYNTRRPHSSLNYRPPVPEAILVPPLATTARSLT